MTSKTAVAPLDRLKILLQAHNNHYKDFGKPLRAFFPVESFHYSVDLLGVFSGLRGIVKNEKIIGLYRGNGAQMVRIFPYSATQFVSYEFYKKVSFIHFLYAPFIKLSKSTCISDLQTLLIHQTEIDEMVWSQS